MLIPAFILMFFLIKKKDSLSQHFSKQSLEKLSVSNQYFSKKARNITLFLSLVFMIIALARPVTNEKIHSSKQELNTIVIAIDVSKSMKATDIYPNRLEFAKKKLLDIINNSKNSAIAVVLFAKSSFILSPLTQDFTSLKILIENLDTGANFDNGTNIYSTLEITNKLLKNNTNKNLLLLTDGGDKIDLSEEIEYAKKNNIDIYTIATASENGAAIKLVNNNYLTNKKGEIVTVKLNKNIKELSLKTNGGFINFSLDNKDITEILKDINAKSKKIEFKEKKFTTYTELFYYPLAFAIFLLFIAYSSIPTLTKRSNLKNLLLTFILLGLSNDLQASIFDFNTIKKANEAYKNEDYKTASKEYKNISNSVQKDYNLANSLYKQGDFKEAINKYKNIKTEDKDLEFNKLHNLGNSYVKSNDLQNAKKTYEDALKLKNDPQTKENLETVNKALKKKQENKKGKNQKEDNNKQKKKQDKNKEPKDSKNSKKKQDKKEDSSKKKNEEKKNESKNKENKNQKESSEKTQKQQNKINSKDISNKEEQKWLEQLKHQKTNSLLKKMKSSKEDEIKNPW